MKTIREIADELNVSKTAVRKKIANLGIGNQFAKIGNQFAINEEQEKLIKSAFLEVRKDKQSETKTETANLEIGNQFAFFEREMEAKNRQIEVLQQTIVSQQEIIEKLSQNLESVSHALEASQALHAGTMQERIEERKERRFFWKRK